MLAGSGYHDPARQQDLDRLTAPRTGDRRPGRRHRPARADRRRGPARPTTTARRLLGDAPVRPGPPRDRRHRRAAGADHAPPTASPACAPAAQEAGRTLPAKRVAYGDFTRDGGAARGRGAARRRPRPHRDRRAQRLDGHRRAGLPARARHRRARRALSVVGFDDMPIARDVTPPLTTVRLPLVEMGVRAMTLALDEPRTSGTRIERWTPPSSSGPAPPHPALPDRAVASARAAARPPTRRRRPRLPGPPQTRPRPHTARSRTVSRGRSSPRRSERSPTASPGTGATGERTDHPGSRPNQPPDPGFSNPAKRTRYQNGDLSAAPA